MKNRNFSAAFLFCILWSSGVSAHYRFSENLLRAQEAVFQLRLHRAFFLIKKEKEADPANRMTDLVECYAQSAKLCIDEDRILYKHLYNEKQSRGDDTLGVDKKSPFYLYNKAEIALQWAIVKFKFQDYMSAALEVRRAYRMLEDNMERFPSFAMNKRPMGLIRILIGTVPDSYRWVLKIVGLEGNIEEGNRLLIEFSQYQSDEPYVKVFQHNARLQYGYMAYHVLKNKEECWKVLNPLTLDYKDNLFHALSRASFAMKCGYNDEAIEAAVNAPDHKNFYHFDYMNYLAGICKMHRLDEDADVYLKKFLEGFKGESYLKDACLKLSWFYLLKGDQQKSDYYRQLILKTGTLHVDEDRHAQRVAERKEEQDVHLLRARLLCDGAYFKRAAEELKGKKLEDFHSEKLKAEFLYRTARVQHGLNDLSKAIDSYHSCIEYCHKMPYYYAANSCLQLGYIYEQLKHYELARFYFKRCAAYNNHEYKNSLQQKAKAGMKRLEGR